jgi:DNA-binding CsgD family transcriptional regulator
MGSRMIDDLERLKDLEDQRVGLQFKVSRLMEMVECFRDEISTIEAEQQEIYRTMGRPGKGTTTADSSNFGLSRSEEAVAFYIKANPPLSNKEIASKLNISERTVKFHIQNIYRKLDIGPSQSAAGVLVPNGNQYRSRILAMRKLNGT